MLCIVISELKHKEIENWFCSISNHMEYWYAMPIRCAYIKGLCSVSKKIQHHEMENGQVVSIEHTV